MAWSRWFAPFAAGALLCAASALWLDAPVMQFFSDHHLIYQQPLQIPVYFFWAMLALPATALIVTAIRFSLRRSLPRQTAVLALAGLAMLATAGVTDLVLKPMFGRSSIGDFFLSPPRYGFFFLNGDFDGTFPSGHAAMAASWLAVLWHFYPRWRWLYAGFAVLLSVSLVVTRDHFLSDVLAGALIGALIGNAALSASRRIIGSTPVGWGLWR